MRFKRQLADALERFALLRWLLVTGVRLFAPRHYVGAVGVIINEAGQVLLVEHVFRPNYRWGLPGGWIERGENPADAVQREIAEELQLSVEVRRLLICEQHFDPNISTHIGMTLAYYCRVSGMPQLDAEGLEILGLRWLTPDDLKDSSFTLTELDSKAIALALAEFQQEQNTMPP